MVNLHSDYYEKDIAIDEQVQEKLFNIYVDVANTQGFEPEISCHDAIDNTEIYDHVAYHVESFGQKFHGYEDVKYLF